MKEIFRDYLFGKGYLVAEALPEGCDYSDTEILCMLVTLGRKCGIRIRHGYRHLTKDVVKYAIETCCQWVPEPFYRGFPESVRLLTPYQLLFDQVYHYAQTYGLGMFDGEADHSILEKFERTAFREETEPREFSVLTEEEAKKLIQETAENLFKSPRPLNASQSSLLKTALQEYGLFFEYVGCKMTAVDLLLETRDLRYCRFFDLPDVIKILERLQYLNYGTEKTNQLNLKNRDRKLLTGVLDNLLSRRIGLAINQRETAECFEKRATWKGLLHHLHYKPKSAFGKEFTDTIRNSYTNLSAISVFEEFMHYGHPADAARALRAAKGSGAVLRNLNYILSRCKTEDDVKGVFECLE